MFTKTKGLLRSLVRRAPDNKGDAVHPTTATPPGTPERSSPSTPTPSPIATRSSAGTTLLQPANPNAVPLPPELIAHILSYLPPESVVSFALTCRRFYQYMPSPPPILLSQQARRALLGWLERENPRQYYCHPCNDLHTWERVPDGHHRLAQYDRHCTNNRGNPRYNLVQLTVNHSPYPITYALARLVMNRHLYGELHGPPLTTLTHEAKHPGENRIMSTHSWTARIINDELYLKATTLLYHHTGRARTLRQHLDDTRSTALRECVCRHIKLPSVTNRPVLPGSGPCRILGLDEHQQPQPPALFVAATGTLKSCRHCFTDYRVDIRWLPPDGGSIGGPKGWVVGVTRWYRIGACRSPQDPKWHNFVTGDALWILESRLRSCEAGMVYRDWRTMDGDDEAASAGEDPGEEFAKASFASFKKPMWSGLGSGSEARENTSSRSVAE